LSGYHCIHRETGGRIWQGDAAELRRSRRRGCV
jgi:hypothetical protein